MKWKKVSEHPLPIRNIDEDHKAWWILRDESNSFSITQYPTCYIGDYRPVEWCEFNPDEIESADSVILKNRNTEIELSWEEKFRWETARDILCAELSNPNGVTQTEEHLKNVVRSVDKIISELKRGRE